MSREKRRYEDDDGRVIADMNVEGMPWHRPKQTGAPDGGEKIQLSAPEARAAMWGALKAALLIALIFGAVFFLFILFCDKVWFGN